MPSGFYSHSRTDATFPCAEVSRLRIIWLIAPTDVVLARTPLSERRLVGLDAEPDRVRRTREGRYQESCTLSSRPALVSHQAHDGRLSTAARLVRTFVVSIAAAVGTLRNRLTFVHANSVIAFLTVEGPAFPRFFAGMRCHVWLLLNFSLCRTATCSRVR